MLRLTEIWMRMSTSHEWDSFSEFKWDYGRLLKANPCCDIAVHRAPWRELKIGSRQVSNFDLYERLLYAIIVWSAHFNIRIDFKKPYMKSLFLQAIIPDQRSPCNRAGTISMSLNNLGSARCSCGQSSRASRSALSCSIISNCCFSLCWA